MFEFDRRRSLSPEREHIGPTPIVATPARWTGEIGDESQSIRNALEDGDRDGN